MVGKIAKVNGAGLVSRSAVVLFRLTGKPSLVFLYLPEIHNYLAILLDNNIQKHFSCISNSGVECGHLAQ